MKNNTIFCVVVMVLGCCRVEGSEGVAKGTQLAKKLGLDIYDKPRFNKTMLPIHTMVKIQNPCPKDIAADKELREAWLAETMKHEISSSLECASAATMQLPASASAQLSDISNIGVSSKDLPATQQSKRLHRLPRIKKVLSEDMMFDMEL